MVNTFGHAFHEHFIATTSACWWHDHKRCHILNVSGPDGASSC